MARRLLLFVLVALAVATLATSAAAKSPHGLMTGFTDGGYLQPANQGLWLSRTVSAGAQMVLLDADWAGIAPRAAAAGTDASDPSNPAYHWGSLDAAVRAAAAHGLTVALAVASNGGPGWADAPGRPSTAPHGTWEPSAGAFGAFAEAVARRYSGAFDPGDGTLPRVRYLQAWGEPNLPDHLGPQWVRSSSGAWVAESPILYRALLDAFYAGVKAVAPTDAVITAGTAPYGDEPGGERVPPALFVRTLLCLNGALHPLPCPDPAHFDVLAHHPYELGAPDLPAGSPDDVSVPDLAKLTRPLHAAVAAGTALPRAPKRLWITEFSYITDPPTPGGVPVATDAKWLEESFYLFWRQGVGAVDWYLLVDQACTPTCLGTYQSGIFYRSGQPKPAFSAFRFPFVAEPAGHRRVTIWGIAPSAGPVHVQIRRRGRWRTLVTIRVPAHGVFTRRITLPGRPLLRATDRRERSLSWRVA